jgi:hypothetical protein
MTKNTTTNNYRIRADQLQNLEIDRNGRVTPRLHDLDPFQNTLLSVLYPGIKVASVNVPAGPLDDYEEAQVENALARLVWNGVHYKLVGASGSAKKGKFYFVDQEHSRAIAERFQHLAASGDRLLRNSRLALQGDDGGTRVTSARRSRSQIGNE